MKKILCVLAGMVSLNAASMCVEEMPWTECVARYKPRLCAAASMVRFQQEITSLCHNNILNTDFDWHDVTPRVVNQLKRQWGPREENQNLERLGHFEHTAHLNFFLTHLMRSEDSLAEDAERLHQLMQELLFCAHAEKNMGNRWKFANSQMYALFDQIDPEQDPDYRKLLSSF